MGKDGCTDIGDYAVDRYGVIMAARRVRLGGMGTYSGRFNVPTLSCLSLSYIRRSPYYSRVLAELEPERPGDAPAVMAQLKLGRRRKFLEHYLDTAVLVYE